MRSNNMVWALILAIFLAGTLTLQALGQDGSSADPIRIDPTGTTSQPVDDNAGSLTIDNTTLAVVGGGVEASSLRVTVANDSTGLLSVDDNGSTLSVDDAGASLTVDNAALSVTGGGVEASALRVTVANDSTGLLSVDDNAGSLTVDAPVGTPVNVQIGDGTNTVDVTATGELEVECIAGCGAATERETFVARVAVDPRANTDYLNVFNAAGSGSVVRVHGIRVETNFDASVVGATIPYTVARTTTAGTTCTAVTINDYDTNNAAVPAQITANSDCTTDPTIAYHLFNCSLRSEENPLGGQNVHCLQFDGNSNFQPITMRVGEGLVVQQTAFSPNANNDSVIATMVFSISAT